MSPQESCVHRLRGTADFTAKEGSPPAFPVRKIH